MAYYPPTGKAGRYHKIEVRVRRPDVRVRARQGYVTPKPPSAAAEKSAAAAAADATKNLMTPEIRSALDSPLPVSGLAMKVFAAPFKGTAPNASVLLGVEMRGRDLRLDASDKVAVTFIAVGGARKGSRGQPRMPWRWSSARDKGARRGHGAAPAEPGRTAAGPVSGSLRRARQRRRQRRDGQLADLDVPDFAKLPFSMSGLVLDVGGGLDAADGPARRATPAGAAWSSRGGAQLPAERRNRTLCRGLRQQGLEAAQGRHHDDRDERRRAGWSIKTEEVRDSSELQGRRGGYGYATRIALKELAPGLLRADVAAQSRLGDTPPAERQVQVHGHRAARGAFAMRPFMLVLVLAVLLPTLPLSPMSQAQTPPPPVRTVVKGQMSEIDVPRQATVRSAAEWSALWKTHDPSGAAARGRFFARDGRGRVSRQPADGRLRGGDCQGGGEQRRRWWWSMSKRRRHATRSRRRY